MKPGKSMARTPAALLSRAASLLAFIVLSFSSIVPISALAANVRGTGGHWSLQPLKAPVVTRTRDDTSPIDAYITARLATNGLARSPEADRATLIRRLSFDLIGLPPSPREIDDFVQNPFPAAYEQLVERLLASPRYGERWGRHWLDVARYTESQGFEYDKLRDNAWHYRDYIIKSFNDDKPYDRFMKEQVAGDVLEPVTSEGIVGASLLVCGPWDEAGNGQANATQKAITREEEMEDMISVVGQTFLGLTINCARCHAHKFDPIPQEEYYRVKSVFEGVKHGERSIANAAEAKAREEHIAALKQEIAAAQDVVARIEEEGFKHAKQSRTRETTQHGPPPFARWTFDHATNAVMPGELMGGATITNGALRLGDRTLSPEEVAASFRAAGYAIPQAEILANLDVAQRAERESALEWIKKHRDTLEAIKPLPMSYAGTRVQPAPTHHLKRGDVKEPGEVVSAGGLSAITEVDPEFGLAADAPEAQRRLKFADWLADPRNPLPARVMANRVWHFHFGQGLVATPNDFGVSGARPTHPALLDWLATKFIESGWSVKALHRLIVNSATYRQSSTQTANDSYLRAVSLDADNQLLWRFPPRRLEAEAVRDAVLSVSGQLNLKTGGPSFRPFDAMKFPANVYLPVDKIGAEFNRRTVYRMNVNSGKEPLLDAFDCPDPSVKTPRRGVTSTPLQALALMNNSFLQRHAGLFAERALAESANDLPRAIRTAYRLALGRPPTEQEAERALAAARARSLTNVCWALLNSTEFVYVR